MIGISIFEPYYLTDHPNKLESIHQIMAPLSSLKPQTAIFVQPGDTLHVEDNENTIIFIGDLKRRDEYPDHGPIRCFASLTHHTQSLSPLLLLKETTNLRVRTSSTANPIDIRTTDFTQDIEERIDDFLNTRPSDDATCMYRQILGETAIISHHSCLVDH